jgi:hypothetical protein
MPQRVVRYYAHDGGCTENVNYRGNRHPAIVARATLRSGSFTIAAATDALSTPIKDQNA